MKLDTRQLRYLTSEDWRVLTAVEMGSRNHELVPTALITQIAGLRGGSGVNKSISTLAKVGLIAKVKNAKYDGYRLTYGGLDYLALNTLRKSDTLFSLGNQIGVGKESDIYVVADPTGKQLVLKLHRLGRISFRTVKENRDYLRNRTTGSWMYLSRLAAMKEYAFMQVLKREGFPIPEPVGQTRHTLVMELIDSFPLRSIDNIADPRKLYSELMELIVRLARVGLIHGDFNEFNILIKEDPVTKVTEPILIDFPQMLSTTHANAKYYFDRDVQCIKTFFARRFHFESDEPGPFLADAIKDSDRNMRLDIEVEASGFSKKLAKDLEKYIETVGLENEQEGDTRRPEDFDDEEDEDDEDDEEETEEDLVQEQLVEATQTDELQDPQVDDPTLVEELGGLDIQDAPHGFDSSSLPLQTPKEDNQVLAAEQKKKKKAAGWAI